MSDEHARFEGLRARLVKHEELTDEELAFLRGHGEECEQCLAEFDKNVSWEDLAKDPRTKPLVDSFAARLRRDLASVEPRRKAKRPAHEVILSKLRERVEELKSVEDAYSDGLRALGVIATLLDVLREMVIPEKEREKVLTELAQLAGLWSAEIAVPNMPEELHNLLVEELLHK